VSCAKTAEPIEKPFGTWTRVGLRKHGVHIGASWQYDLIVHMRRRCGLTSNYFHHLFCYASRGTVCRHV